MNLDLLMAGVVPQPTGDQSMTDRALKTDGGPG